MIVTATYSHLIVPCDILQFVFSVVCQWDNRKNTEVGHSPWRDQNLIWTNSLKSPETTHLSIFTQNMLGYCRIFLSMILSSSMTCEGDSLHSKKGLCGSSAVWCYCEARRECVTIRRAIQRWLFVFMLSVTAGQIGCRCFINGITFTFSSGLSSDDNTPPLNTRDIHYCGLLFFVMGWWDIQLHAFQLPSA